MRIVIFLIISILSGATAALLVKSSAIAPFHLGMLRLWGACLFVLPFYIRARKRSAQGPAFFSWSVIFPGLFLGLHFMAWNVGCRHVPVANATLFINLVPVVMPFLLYTLVGEKVNRREILGTILALAGLAVLVLPHLGQSESLIWDGVNILSTVLYAIYLALGRRNRDVPDFLLYITPLYFFAGVVCAVFSLLTEKQVIYTGCDYFMLLVMIVVPTLLGHGMVNYALRFLRGQIVSLGSMCQVIFATLFGFALLREVPEWNFYPAMALMLSGAVVALLGLPRKEQVITPDQ